MSDAPLLEVQISRRAYGIDRGAVGNYRWPLPLRESVSACVFLGMLHFGQIRAKHFPY